MDETHPEPTTGVAAPEPPRLLPSSDSWASRSFCSMASARRLRKSERLTRPTVWFERMSSAVLACGLKRGLGVEVPEEGFDMAVRCGIGGTGR